MFEEMAERWPDRVAIVFEEEQLSYGSMNERTNRLAHFLIEVGVGAEVRVALCMKASMEMVIALMAVLKAGAAYVPLDPLSPPLRLAFMLDNSHAPILLTNSQSLAFLPATLAHPIALDHFSDSIQSFPHYSPPVALFPSNLAYLIYTSGSTGHPKAVMVEHRGLRNMALSLIQPLQITSQSRLLQFASPSFDASVYEIFTALLGGATLCLASRQEMMPGPDLINYLTMHEITTVTLPPSVLRAMDESELPALQTVVAAGEACGAEIVEKWGRGRRFINAYGPTEITVCATWGVCDGGEARPRIGQPMSNTKVYVVDKGREAVGIGVRGELEIGGEGVARGYEGEGGLTAEKYVPNRNGGGEGERVYKTGDKVRWDEEGRLEYIGRIDEQVKVRGYRIELEEIEAVMMEQEGVKQSAVVVREEEGGEKRLIGYVVMKEGARVATGIEMRKEMERKLPEYMVPREYVEMKEMPLTINGKVDKKALPAPEQNRLASDNYIAPQTDVEETLATIWKQVLRLDRVGIDDNFFTLGGDSILSIQVVSRASKAGLRLIPRQIFEYQTIAKLAAVIGTAEEIAAEQMVVTGEVTLTPIQQWFFERELPDPHHYNQSVLLSVPADLDFGYLEQAVENLLTHHDALRLRFEHTDVGWRQFNAEAEDHQVCLRDDLSQIPRGDRAATIEVEAARAQASLDLTQGPLLRVIYFDFGRDERGRLLWVIHHLAVDGVSWRILLDDLETAYQQLSSGEEVRLASKTTSYREWAKRLQEYEGGIELLSEVNYWSEQVRPGSGQLPVDFPEGENTEQTTQRLEVLLSQAETISLLQEVPHAYQTQINDVLLTALGESLCWWSGAQAITVDLEGHGREEEIGGVELSRTVGWFTSIYPVRLEVVEAESDGQALKRVKEQLRAIPHRGLGYGVLRYLSQDAEVSAQLKAEIEVSFNYLGQFDQVVAESKLWGITTESSGASQSVNGWRSHLLEITGMIVGGELRLVWSYSAAIHRRESIKRVADRYLEKLKQLIVHCKSPEAGGYTPSDFREVSISQKEIDDLLTGLE
jgi:amino acid adenylation domain-containing protein/non-ribosomal peptide synthase protein (TIGR01720 family)